MVEPVSYVGKSALRWRGWPTINETGRVSLTGRVSGKNRVFQLPFLIKPVMNDKALVPTLRVGTAFVPPRGVLDVRCGNAVLSIT